MNYKEPENPGKHSQKYVDDPDSEFGVWQVPPFWHKIRNKLGQDGDLFVRIGDVVVLVEWVDVIIVEVVVVVAKVVVCVIASHF